MYTQVNAGFIRLLGMNRPEWLWALVGTAGSAGLGIMYPAFGLALSNIIGVFYNPDHAKMKSTVQTWCIVFAAVGGFALVCATVQQYALTLMGQRLTKRLRVLLMQALLRQVCCCCGAASAQPVCLYGFGSFWLSACLHVGIESQVQVHLTTVLLLLLCSC